jgi:hypothetical protein
VAQAWISDQPIDWFTVSSNLDPVCQPAVGYVEDISRLLKPAPTPTTWLPIGTSIPTPVMPRVIGTPTPTPLPFQQSPTPTATSTLPVVVMPTTGPTSVFTAAPTGSAFIPTVTPTLEEYPYP